MYQLHWPNRATPHFGKHWPNETKPTQIDVAQQKDNMRDILTGINAALKSGKLEIGRREIARCDNDPNFPNHGLFTIQTQGG